MWNTHMLLHFPICKSLLVTTLTLLSVQGSTRTEEYCNVTDTNPTGVKGQLDFHNKLLSPNCRWAILSPEVHDAIIISITLSVFSCDDGYLEFTDDASTCGICDNSYTNFCQIYVITGRCTKEEIMNFARDEIGCERVLIHSGFKNAKMQISSLNNSLIQVDYAVAYYLYECKGTDQYLDSTIGSGRPIFQNKPCSRFTEGVTNILQPNTTESTTESTVSSTPHAYSTYHSSPPTPEVTTSSVKLTPTTPQSPQGATVTNILQPNTTESTTESTVSSTPHAYSTYHSSPPTPEVTTSSVKLTPTIPQNPSIPQSTTLSSDEVTTTKLLTSTNEQENQETTAPTMPVENTGVHDLLTNGSHETQNTTIAPTEPTPQVTTETTTTQETTLSSKKASNVGKPPEATTGYMTTFPTPPDKSFSKAMIVGGSLLGLILIALILLLIWRKRMKAKRKEQKQNKLRVEQEECDTLV